MKKNLPIVSIIIVNWNGKNVLKDCLKTVKTLVGYPFEIIFVDNGSTDGSVRVFSELKGNFGKKIIRNKNNLGFAPANNQGYSAVSTSSKYILFLNYDTKVPSTLLKKMIPYLDKHPLVGAIQPKIRMWDQPNRLDNCGTFLNLLGLSEHWGYGEVDGSEFDNERIIFSAKGACMLVRKSIIENVGLFDPHFHSYFEESDFCWRVWLSGSSVVYFPGIDIYHKVGFASKRLPQTIVTYHGIKNRIFSLFKNLDTGHLFSIFLIHIVFLFCLAAYYLIRLQFEKAYMIYKGLLWNLIHLRLLVVSRSQVQKIRTVSDRIIFSSIMHPIQPIKLFQHFLKVEANFK